MNNREIFLEDPLEWTLKNEGVSSNNNLDPETVQYELRTFVCEGEYKNGLVRILEGYLKNFRQPEQKAAWISGFFGSGKSHLAKVLRYLWTDHKFENGVSARALAKLPPEVADLLKELSTLAAGHGGFHSAGGTLKAGKSSVRIRLLGLLFQSVGLPESYYCSKFLLHLRRDGKEHEFRKYIAAGGGVLEAEIERLYSSRHVAEAYLKCYPHIGSLANVSPALRADYPDAKDVSITEMLAVIREAVGHGGKLPCTLIVLDEVQQFIGSNSDLSHEIQEVTEACSKQLDSRVMFVGTGQSALSDTPILQRLIGRYVIKCHLRDNDVERVVRTVVLQKKEAAKPAIQEVISKHEGEITRQLKATKIGSRTEDQAAYVADYPLLPVRLRFWEKVLQSVDPTGTAAQMRTQLRVAHEACREFAERPLGTVVPADFIYDQIATQLVQTGEMQKRFQEIIEEQRKKADGALRNRLCALVFLIGKVSRKDVDIGVRANAEHLADLLSDDIKLGSTELRQKVPTLLKTLVEEGVLMDVEGEYSLQTTEGASWEAEFRQRRSGILANDQQIEALRATALSKAVHDAVGDLRVLHGDAREPRNVEIHHGVGNPPSVDGVTVWVRDGFSEAESSVLADIQKRSVDDPTIHVFIPKLKLDELRHALASAQAADETCHFKGTPTTQDGGEARRAMTTRKSERLQRADEILTQIVRGARVYLSGGQELPIIALHETIEDAASQALARLYPKFQVADSANWPTVWDKARQGNPGALGFAGYNGDPQTHPVALELLKAIGAGKRGAELRKQYQAAPYGWPQEALDAVLATLLASNHLSARLNGQALLLGELDHRKVGLADFRVEFPVLTVAQKLKVRQLYQAAALKFTPGDESGAAPGFLALAKKMAVDAGGEPPAPETPSRANWLDLDSKSGNELLLALHDRKEALQADLTQWAKLAEGIARRSTPFQTAGRMLTFAQGHPKHAAWRQTLADILVHRALLSEPDPVSPLLQDLGIELRKACAAAHKQFQTAYAHHQERLGQHSLWSKLAPEVQKQLLRDAGAVEVPAPKIGTDAELLAGLEACDLPGWQARVDALTAQFDKALAVAIQKAEPKARRVSLPTATVRTTEDLDLWISEARAIVEEAMADGPVIL